MRQDSKDQNPDPCVCVCPEAHPFWQPGEASGGFLEHAVGVWAGAGEDLSRHPYHALSHGGVAFKAYLEEEPTLVS